MSGFARRIYRFLAVSLAVGPGGACADDASHVAPSELLEQIEAGKAPVIVDVRTQREYESGHVPGALHVPFWAAWTRAAQIPAPREGPIVVYCEHGPRAGIAKAAFRFSGFERVLYLEGHMSRWKKLGLRQETSQPSP